MNDTFWKGLWASGMLTGREYRRWSPVVVEPHADIKRAFDEDAGLPARWRELGAQGLVDKAARGYAALRETIERTPHEVRIVEAATVRAGLRAPFLSVVGRLPPENGLLAVVGTRRLQPEEEGRVVAWLRPVVRTVVGIVSGGALGIDALAHRLALEEGTPTWAVLAGGADLPTPQANRALFETMIASAGGWLSERPPGYRPRDYDFLERNRVIAQLSSAVLVARAPARSGALSTAREARALAIPVGAIPGAPDDWNAEGCNQLIADGATLVRGAGDLARMGFGDAHTGLLFDVPRGEVSAAACTMGDEEHEALRAFIAWTGADSAWIADDAGRHQEVVLDLELAGLVQRDVAGAYELSAQGKRCKNHG